VARLSRKGLGRRFFPTGPGKGVGGQIGEEIKAAGPLGRIGPENLIIPYVTDFTRKDIDCLSVCLSPSCFTIYYHRSAVLGKSLFFLCLESPFAGLPAPDSPNPPAVASGSGIHRAWEMPTPIFGLRPFGQTRGLSIVRVAANCSFRVERAAWDFVHVPEGDGLKRL
jgi:hypothetical protein